MQYFKHSELVKNYHISLKTVHNWIDAAKRGKTSLKLFETNNRIYIAATPENSLILEQLSQKSKKYRNTLHYKTIHPKADFYEIYAPRQILDIITNMELYREIPRQYNYLGEGAVHWDNWLKNLAKQKTPNMLVSTIDLIHTNMTPINKLLGEHSKVNVIDLGVGNAYPVKELLGNLTQRGILHKYIGIDISPTMLTVAKKNITKWYGDKVKFEGHVRDITRDYFDDLFLEDMLSDTSEKIINVVLLLGGTPTNFRFYDDAFRVAHKSMGANDVLLFMDRVDTEATRLNFDFNAKVAGSSIQPGIHTLSPNHSYILELMNIDESFYEVEKGFDAHQKIRYIRIRLKTALTIKFNLAGTERAVNLEKGDTLLLLRVRHLTSLEIISQFDKIGFNLLHSSLTNDRQYFLSISGVETKKLES